MGDSKATETRPDYVKCVQLSASGTWCGRALGIFEWAFQGVDHAAQNGASGSRLVVCPECVAQIIAALRGGSHG